MVVSDVTLSMIRAKRMCRSFLWNLHKQRLTWRIRAIVCLYLAVHFASDLRITRSQDTSVRFTTNREDTSIIPITQLR